MPVTRRTFLASAAVAAAAAMPSRAQSAGRPPNIIVIYADDLGYGDLGCYGAAAIRTPRLDRMAAEGMRFTDFYSGAPVCTPSRIALLTGRYPVRSGLNEVLFPLSKTGIPAGEVTMAEVLRGAGYATACIGKWHLGHLPEFLPTRHGFDSYFGIPYSNDMDREQPPLMRGETIVEQPAVQDTLTQRYTAEAQEFIRAHRGRPFFLYLAHAMPHVPLHASEAFRGKSPGGLYGDVVEELDWSTGALLDTLAECGLDADTLVVFTSDNGPWLAKGEHGGSAGALRMGKGSTFEGGLRVPCILRWPGAVAPGSVHAGVAGVIDLLPTCAAIAGAASPADRPIDGCDLGPVLRGTGTRAHQRVFYCARGRAEAVRDGKWKFKRPFDGNVYGEKVIHGPLLIDLESDPGEQHNRFDAGPEIAARLEAAIAAFEREAGIA